MIGRRSNRHITLLLNNDIKGLYVYGHAMDKDDHGE